MQEACTLIGPTVPGGAAGLATARGYDRVTGGTATAGGLEGMSVGTAVVTGGAGFIGSHVVDSLLADGVQVVVVDDLSNGSADRVAAEADFELVDVTDAGAVAAVFDQARPSAVYHLAAQASVTLSVDDPGRDCAVNVQGTLNVLEGARRHGAHVVYSSTGGALYGDDAPIPTGEDRVPKPLSPYGASKWAGEAYVVTWAASNRTPHTICRLANVYGPRQSPHGEAGVVAIFSHRLWSGQRPTLFGHGDPTRDYVHVLDVVAAMRASAGRGGVYNIATGIETPVREIFEGLRKAAGVDVEPELAPLRAGELERSCLDPSLAREELGWRALIRLGDGLPATYASFLEAFQLGRAF
jgi:UDP-glucose 4-epimerase